MLIVAPHTSNWDFALCILAMFALGLRLSWLGKHSIFFWPASPILRWLGGEPIERGSSLGTVEQAIARFAERPQWVFGLAPEGTRKRTDGWKSGYYRVAVGAGVPIVPVALDYQQRVVAVDAPFWPTGDYERDSLRLRRGFRAEMARHPDRFAPLTESRDLLH
ncbi:MAG: 1-acyl-sn-glycerol-3-phosphate acyltransferase [Gemmatimonadota bacterium]